MQHIHAGLLHPGPAFGDDSIQLALKIIGQQQCLNVIIAVTTIRMFGVRGRKLIRWRDAIYFRVMDQIDFGLFGPGRHPEGQPDPIFERSFYVACAVDVVVRVPVNGPHIREVLFVCEPRIDEGLPECARLLVARIIVDGRQGDQAHLLAVVKLVEQYVRKLIDRPDVGIGSRTKLCCD